MKTIRTLSDGRALIELDNGQVWRHEEERQLLRTAERAGLEGARVEALRARIARGLQPAELAEVQHELRRFIQRRMEDHAARAARGG